jgi:RTX calcium-binding nonapeptide repeat (4 copies)
MRTPIRTSILLAVIGATLVSSASLALAAPTTVTGGGEQNYDYQLKAAAGTMNDIGVSLQPGSGGFLDYVFSDSAGLVTPLYLSCRAPDGSNAAEGVHNTLICGAPIPEPFQDNALRIEAGDGNDTIQVAFGQAPGFDHVAQNLKGEEGNDTISGSGPAVLDTFIEPLLDGGPGNDQLRSGSNQKIKGRGGIDRIFARNGVKNLKINCGAGSDKKEFAQRDRKDPKAKSC